MSVVDKAQLGNWPSSRELFQYIVLGNDYKPAVHPVDAVTTVASTTTGGTA
jgi:hypothetical protein